MEIGLCEVVLVARHGREILGELLQDLNRPVGVSQPRSVPFRGRGRWQVAVAASQQVLVARDRRLLVSKFLQEPDGTQQILLVLPPSGGGYVRMPYPPTAAVRRRRPRATARRLPRRIARTRLWVWHHVGHNASSQEITGAGQFVADSGRRVRGRCLAVKYLSCIHVERATCFWRARRHLEVPQVVVDPGNLRRQADVGRCALFHLAVAFNRPQVRSLSVLELSELCADVADAPVCIGSFPTQIIFTAALGGESIVECEQVFQQGSGLLRQDRLRGDLDLAARGVVEGEFGEFGHSLRGELLEDVVEGFQCELRGRLRFLSLPGFASQCVVDLGVCDPGTDVADAPCPEGGPALAVPQGRRRCVAQEPETERVKIHG